MLPVTYTVSRNSKERGAIDALGCGLLMLCLYSLTVSITYSLKGLSKSQAHKEQGEIAKAIDFQDRDLKRILEEES